MKLAYEAQGQRFRKQIGSNPAVYFAYDLQGQLLGEYTLIGNSFKPLMEYIWLEGQPVVVVRPTPGAAANAPNSAQEVFYLHTDHLGTPRVALDTAGRVRWRWMGGEPFGPSPAENTPTSGLSELNISLRLPGQQYDGFVGLHYNYFRDYDPTVGRYVQSDPIGLAGGINTYAYVGGNPLSYTDPLGLAPRKLDPGSLECRQLQDKIKRRSDSIAKYARDIYNNPQKLPVNPSIPGLPDKFSQLGHAERMEREIGFQRRDIELYSEKCGCPDDDCKNGGAGATQSTPQSMPSPSSSSSSTANKIAIGGGILVCAAACIAFPQICVPGLLLGGLATR